MEDPNDVLDRGWAHLDAGRLVDAAATAARLEDRARAADDEALLAEALNLRGAVQIECGEVEEAERSLAAALAAKPSLVDASINLTQLLIHDFEDYEAALTVIEEALEQDDVDPELAAELYDLAGEACAVLYRPEDALSAHEKAVELAPDVGRFHASLGLARYDLWDFDGARAAAEQAVALAPDDPEGHHVRELVAERLGDATTAVRSQARAQELDAERFHAPLEVSADQLGAVAEAALGELPEHIRRYLTNVPVLIEEQPDEASCRENDPPLSPGILARFSGTPLPLRSVQDPWSHFPAAIELYRRNLARACATHEELREEVAHTLLHEVGHFLGLDEDDLYARGLE